MALKDYSRGDGTAYRGMAKVTPKLRAILIRRSHTHIPSACWVKVDDYTLWTHTPIKYGGGMSRIIVSTENVMDSIVEYRTY